MNELQRMQYLDALGVDTYMPRYTLPLGGDSRLCMPVPVVRRVAVSEGPAPVVDGAVESSSSAMVQALLEPAQAAPANDGVKDNPSLPNPVADFTEPSAVSAVSFSLSIWVVSECLIVDSRRQGSGLPTDALLANMVRAMGWQVSGAAEVFRWPMEEMPTLVDAASAKDVLQSLFDVKVETAAVSRCLLMGEDALNYCSNADGFANHLGGAVDTLYEGLQACVIPSLESMLMDPKQKAIAWKALQQWVQGK